MRKNLFPSLVGALGVAACSTPVLPSDAGLDAFTPTVATDAFVPVDAPTPVDVATPVDDASALDAATPVDAAVSMEDAFTPADVGGLADAFVADVGTDAGVPVLATWEATLTAGVADDRLGWRVSISADGSRALVASISELAETGAARVFALGGSGWAEEAALRAPDGEAGDRLGYGVALSGDGLRAILGAPQDDTAAGANAGSARVFVRTGSTWTPEATLLLSAPAASDGFGDSVAINRDGTIALVGCSNDDGAAGSVTVFTRSGVTWREEAVLRAPDAAAGDYFGASLALSESGERAVIGAHGDDTVRGTDTGSARVFVRSGTSWTFEAMLVASDGAASDQLGLYGAAVSADGSRAVVGARQHDTVSGGMDAGSAYVFSRVGTMWSEEAILVARDGAAMDLFGLGVSLSGDGARAVVTAHRDDRTVGMDAGSVRLFVRSGTTWTEVSTLASPTAAAFDFFGQSAAISTDGRRALVGVIYADTAIGMTSGSAQVFTLAP
ncbi:MAG: hypothetical protein U0353_17625 [Sandaracinus sp.]